MSDGRGLEAGAPVAAGAGPEGGGSGPDNGASDRAAAYEREWQVKRSGLLFGGAQWVVDSPVYDGVIGTTTAAGPYAPPPKEPITRLDNQFQHCLFQAATDVIDLVIQRHKKYGPFNVANAPGGALNGIVVRLHDKLSRLGHGLENHDDESVEDTVLDIVGYGLIALMVLRGEWPGTD